MNIVLWVIQGLLALVFLMSGFMKTFRPLESLKKSMSWTNNAPPIAVRLLGVAEILGAIGLILPGVTNILPWLTVAAAVGFMIVMIGACILHALHKEYNVIGVTIILLFLAALIVIGRLAIAPLA
jgi:uncharacterized membrane protein YphA (DoxX/SURF4 family)